MTAFRIETRRAGPARAGLFIGVLALAACATEESGAVPPDFEDAAARLLAESYPEDGPGAAAVVARDGEIVFLGAEGLADVAAGREIDPENAFRMGSVTKQFAAAVALQLSDEGRLDLDAPVTDYLSGYPAAGGQVTVRMLLNHTSGIPSYTSLPGWMVEENTAPETPTEDMVAVFEDLPFDFEPGTRFAYNNSGYLLLGAVIEAVTGESWYEAIEGRISDPLGLETVRYGEREVAAGRVEGYTEEDGEIRPAMAIHMSVPHAAGGLIGSVGDMARWAEALHGGRVVSPQAYALMTAPTVLPDGETVPYGYGLATSQVRGHKAIGHGGGIFGFSTASTYLPEERLFAAVFANSDAPESAPELVMQKLLAAALGDPYPVFEEVAAAPSDYEEFFGVYEIGEGETRAFFHRDGAFRTQRGGGSVLEVRPAGEGRFFYEGRLDWFVLERGADGTPRMAFHQDGAKEPEIAVYGGPVPDAPDTVDLPRATLEIYAGAYELAIGPVAEVRLREGGLTVQLPGQPELAMDAVSETEFVLRDVDARVVFSDIADGEAGAMTIFQAGQEIPGTRQ